MVTKNPKGEVVFDNQSRVREKERKVLLTNKQNETDMIQDKYYIVGWTIGVILAVLVAIVLTSGFAPSSTTIAITLPLLIGSFLAATHMSM